MGHSPHSFQIEQLTTLMRYISFTFLIFFVFAFTITGTAIAEYPDPAPGARKHLYRAEQELKKKHYRKSIHILKNLIEKQPDQIHPLVYYVLGNAYYLSGSREQAYHAYKTGHHLDPSNASLCTNLAKTAYEQGNYLLAARKFEQAFQLTTPKDPLLLYHGSVAYYHSKDFTKAEKMIKSYISLHNRFSQKAYSLLIHTYMEQKSWKKAEKSIIRYLRHMPDNVEYRYLLAELRIKMKKYREAVSALEIAHQIKPLSLEKMETLSDLYQQIGAYFNSAHWLEIVYSKKTDVTIMKNIYAIYRQGGMAEKALYWLDRIIEKKPNYNHFFEKGVIFFETGKWNMAIEAFEKCVTLRPEEHQPVYLMGICAFEAGKYKKAIQCFKKTLKSKTYYTDSKSFMELIEGY
jgi:tetratricopeptide (TPR) repeat protein